MYELTFLPERALEALLYLAQKLEKPTIHELLKLRYFADKIHLSKYGFMGSGDCYVAMKFGPVASHTYNMIKAARGDKGDWIHPRFAELVSGNLSVNKSHVVSALRQPNLEFLSKADIECMDEAIARYGNMKFGERTELSHDEAWRKAWEAASEDAAGAEEMSLDDIVLTLDNANDILDYIRH